jgi:methionine salvage enolase-phosphatase E1
MQSVRGSASMTAILTDSEGAASPLRFLTEILLLHAHDRLGPFIVKHATVEDIERGSYRAIPEHLALPPQEILVVAERGGAQPAEAVGLARIRIAREIGASGAHPITAGFASVRLG